MPLQGGNITVGRDIPLGTEVFRQTFMASPGMKLVCSTGAYNIEVRRGLPVPPLPLSSWTGTPWGGKVYQTGVPGIGVALWYNGAAFPSITNLTNCTVDGLCYWTPTLVFDISFIKIGEVSPGTILGAQLPTMNNQHVSSNALEIERVNMSGSLNVVARTCETQDVTVEMGSHKISELPGLVAPHFGKTFPFF